MFFNVMLVNVMLIKLRSHEHAAMEVGKRGYTRTGGHSPVPPGHHRHDAAKQAVWQVIDGADGLVWLRVRLRSRRSRSRRRRRRRHGGRGPEAGCRGGQASQDCAIGGQELLVRLAGQQRCGEGAEFRGRLHTRLLQLGINPVV